MSETISHFTGDMGLFADPWHGPTIPVRGLEEWGLLQ